MDDERQIRIGPHSPRKPPDQTTQDALTLVKVDVLSTWNQKFNAITHAVIVNEAAWASDRSPTRRAEDSTARSIVWDCVVVRTGIRTCRRRIHASKLVGHDELRRKSRPRPEVVANEAGQGSCSEFATTDAPLCNMVRGRSGDVASSWELVRRIRRSGGPWHIHTSCFTPVVSSGTTLMRNVGKGISIFLDESARMSIVKKDS